MSMKILLLCVIVLINGFNDSVVAHDHQFQYTPHEGAQDQDGLVVYYIQQRSEQANMVVEHPLYADYYLKLLTIRSPRRLTAVDILSVVYDVAKFYGPRRLNELGIARLKILWGLQQNSDGVFSYEGGVMVDRDVLDAVLSSIEQVELIGEFAHGIQRIVPADSFDPGDDQSSGANMELGTIHTLNEGDQDWFYHSVSKGGYYVVETLPVEDRLRVDTVIEISADDQVITDDDGSDEFLYSRALIEISDNTMVTVKVTSYGTSGGYYILSMSSVPFDAVPIDQYEPNDTIGTAKIAAMGSEIAGMLNSNVDVDWFEIQGLERERTYEVLLFSNDYETKATMYVGDSAGASLEFTPSGRFLLESKGRIFLKIDGRWSGEYTFVIREDEPPRL